MGNLPIWFHSENMTGNFTCESCGFSLKFDYFGTKPYFCKQIRLVEESYVKKDPFTEKNKCIVLGSHCSLCNKKVCVAKECSLFYTKRFCIGCVEANIEEFPDEIKQELQKKS